MSAPVVATFTLAVELRQADGFLLDLDNDMAAWMTLHDSLRNELDEAFGHPDHDLKYEYRRRSDLGGWQVFATGGAAVPA